MEGPADQEWSVHSSGDPLQGCCQHQGDVCGQGRLPGDTQHGQEVVESQEQDSGGKRKWVDQITANPFIDWICPLHNLENDDLQGPPGLHQGAEEAEVSCSKTKVS